jgi:hypothetical protein
MKYILFLAAVFISTVTPTLGQASPAQPNRCALKLAQSPAIRGIRLGMKLDDVLALFPGSRENDYVKFTLAANSASSNFGLINIGISPALYPNKERFLGIDQFSFVFVDEQMVRLYAEYRQPPWPRLDEFIDKVSGAFQLPPSAQWAVENAARKNLMCDGFRIRVATQDQRASLTIEINDDPYKIQRERRDAAEEKARREFKP